MPNDQTGRPNEKEPLSDPASAGSPPLTSGGTAADKDERVRAHGDWSNVFVSGVVGGVVMAVAFAKLGIVPAFMVSAAAFAFCVTNKNFRFSWLQTLVATGLMLFIGTQYELILEFLRSTMTDK